MGSVIERPRFSHRQKISLLIFTTYFIAGFTFITIGMQPVKDSASVYASEAESATSLLSIDSIGLHAPVKNVMLNGKTLEVPEQIAGSYSVHNNKTLVIGHSSTIFSNLKNTTTGMEISYNGKKYTITDIVNERKEDIVMKEILKTEENDTLILMTCSGEKIEGTTSDYTHRIIITAKEQ